MTGQLAIQQLVTNLRIWTSFSEDKYEQLAHLLGVHHSALGDVEGPHLQCGVIGWAEGSWELILVQLFMCIVNHFLTVLPTIQIPLDL